MTDFVEFPKIARLSRLCVISEKIDGTNAQVNIRLESEGPFEVGVDIRCVGPADETVYVRAGSRARWLSMRDDNYGFARWVHNNAHELARLGLGAHFGEWWGLGIQRSYGQDRKRFSLFNTHRWADASVRPACCDVVPILYSGIFDTKVVEIALDQLSELGSMAAPGFMRPEGVIVYHEASRTYFKKTLHKDEEWKGKAA